MPPTILSIQLQLCNIPIDNISIVSTALAAIVARTRLIRRFAEESIVVIDIVARGRSVVSHYGIFRSLVVAVVGWRDVFVVLLEDNTKKKKEEKVSKSGYVG